MGRSQTFNSEDFCRRRLFEVIGLAAMRPLPQEVPQQSTDQYRNTSDTANYTTDDRSNRSRLCGPDGESRLAASCKAGCDEDVVDDEYVGLVGCGHRDINLVLDVWQYWRLEVDDPVLGPVNDWMLGSGCNAESIKRLTMRPFVRRFTRNTVDPVIPSRI